MIIKGYFHFLHSINVAWLLRGQEMASAHNTNLSIEIRKAKSDSPASMQRRLDYLSAFGFSDRIFAQTVADETEPSTVPIPESDPVINGILNPWIEQYLNHTIFLDKNAKDKLPDLVTGKSIITTNGCFDILHPGHLATLKYAASLGDELIVLINSDLSVKRFKGSTRPIHAHGFRAALLSQLPWVDKVVVFHGDTPLELLEIIKPAGHVKGGSFIPERIKTEKDLLARWGGSLHSIPMVGDYSSTNLLESFSNKPFPL